MIYINKCLKEKDYNISDIVFYDRLSDEIIEKGKFIFGSISDANYLKRNGYNDKVSFWNLKVSEFLPQITNFYINYKDSYFKQVCMLNDNDIDMFCRSDSGCKLFSGQILDKYSINLIKSTLQPDDLLFLSNKRIIVNERRYWIYNNKIVTSIGYPKDNNENYDNFVNELVNYWCPDILYTLDVGTLVSNQKPYVIEYNCWSTSGFYDANLNKIIEATNEIKV